MIFWQFLFHLISLSSVQEGEDDVVIEEIKDKVDDGDIEELDEAVGGIKLQQDNGDNALQGLANDDNDNQDNILYLIIHENIRDCNRLGQEMGTQQCCPNS
ncbi:uncharacterized protein LOC113681635 [Pocillopora damicornis]|uniref:uncharacterized protein LOC113681635 n=1 Tax=Pocillopora damicornis TaxID=46731 RepID=UPI000F557E6B|nr:uncharacterized protein LOC113681635 [Pocillopora damicornis]